jgi:hypothetical protein
MLNIGAALFGSNQVVIKAAEEMLSPACLNALRFSAAAICFLPLVPRALNPKMIPAGVELGMWLTRALSNPHSVGHVRACTTVCHFYHFGSRCARMCHRTSA